MFAPVIVKRRSKNEAEKPFWISYADLLTALMVLFWSSCRSCFSRLPRRSAKLSSKRLNAKKTSRNSSMKSSKQQIVIQV
jgi:hypothetical protein